MVEQPGFIYFECPMCEFSSVQKSTFSGDDYCPMCAEDNGRDVSMHMRVCQESDKPEGRDARRSVARP